MSTPNSSLPFLLADTEALAASELLTKLLTVLSMDNVPEGASYARLQKAKADQINAGTYDAPKCSAFGLGSVSALITNLDDTTLNGEYRYAAGATGAPTANAGVCYFNNYDTGIYRNVIAIDVITGRIYYKSGKGVNLASASWRGGGDSSSVYFSRSLASGGSQSVTGVGFKPSAIIFYGILDSPNLWFIGAFGKCLNLRYSGSLGLDGAGIDVYPASGQEYFMSIASYDADGFTLSWTRTGSPGGTLYIQAICFR